MFLGWLDQLKWLDDSVAIARFAHLSERNVLLDPAPWGMRRITFAAA